MTKPILPQSPFLPSRRQVLLASAAAGAGLLLPRGARAASIPFDLECNSQAGFTPDPNAHQRVGYLTNLNGFGLAAPLAADLLIYTPWPGAPAYTGVSITPPSATVGAPVVRAVGVMSKMMWDGGVGGALHFEFYVSQQNAMQIKSLQQLVLKTTKVTSLGYWIIDYDQQLKMWYEQAYPLSAPTLSGVINNKNNPVLNVDLNPVMVKSGIDVNVYKVTLEMAPAANQAYTLHFANAANKPVTKSWGLVVGTAP